MSCLDIASSPPFLSSSILFSPLLFLYSRALMSPRRPHFSLPCCHLSTLVLYFAPREWISECPINPTPHMTRVRQRWEDPEATLPVLNFPLGLARLRLRFSIPHMPLLLWPSIGCVPTDWPVDKARKGRRMSLQNLEVGHVYGASLVGWRRTARGPEAGSASTLQAVMLVSSRSTPLLRYSSDSSTHNMLSMPKDTPTTSPPWWTRVADGTE